MIEGHIFLVSTCGTPTAAVVFNSVEKSLTAFLCQTLCMDSLLKKPEKQNPKECKCTTLHLPAGALGCDIARKCIMNNQLSSIIKHTFKF